MDVPIDELIKIFDGLNDYLSWYGPLFCGISSSVCEELKAIVLRETWNLFAMNLPAFIQSFFVNQH